MAPQSGREPVTHGVFDAFLTRIFDSGISVVTSELLRVELAETIVTLDTGFALLPASLLTVYTDRSRLASCRKKRPR
jgi:hypothetical protein